MQNKFIYTLLIGSILGCASVALAQEEAVEIPEAPETVAAEEPAAPPETEEITPVLDGKQPVDFPAHPGNHVFPDDSPAAEEAKANPGDA